MDALYNISRAAKFLGVTRQTLYRWEKEGKIKFISVGDFQKVSETELKRLRGE